MGRHLVAGNAGGVGTTPLVSVIVPAYLAAPYIAETLDSILRQTFSDYEIVVVNDGSPDTEELERVLRPYGDRIIYITQENGGPGAARNAGIRASRGKYLAFLDADDQWEPQFLEYQTGVMEADATLDVHYCDAVVFGDTRRAGRTVMEFTVSAGEVNFESLVRRQCTVLICAALVRRDAVLKAGMFNEALRGTEDVDLWLRIARQGGRIAYERRVLSRYRVRKGSLSSDPSRMIEGYLQVLTGIRNTPGLMSRDIRILDDQFAVEEAMLFLSRGKESLLKGETGAAATHLTRANAFLRSGKIAVALLLMRIAPKTFVMCYRNLHSRTGA